MKNIEFKNVCKSFGENRVLDNFSAIFPKGSRTAVMGPSGSGKTTLLRLIMGLEKCDSGVIEGIEGEHFGCVFQEDRLIEDISAAENLKLIFDGKLPKPAITAELASVELTGENLIKPVKEFSGGMKRRVAIVRAMMSDSDTVIMDEPFTGLDEELKDRVMDYIEDSLGARRLILVTHERSEAERLCERVVEITLDKVMARET